MIEQSFGVKPTLIKGGGGVFDVRVNGKLIYSRHQTGRFPVEAQIKQAIESM